MKMPSNWTRTVAQILAVFAVGACILGCIWIAPDIDSVLGLPPALTEAEVVEAKVRVKVDEYNAITVEIGKISAAERRLREEDPGNEIMQGRFADSKGVREARLGAIALELEEMGDTSNLLVKRIVERHQRLRARTTVRIPAEGEMELSFAQGQKVEIGETSVSFFDIEGEDDKLGVGVNSTAFLGFEVACVISEEHPLSIRGIRFVLIEKGEDGFLFKLVGDPGTWVSLVDPIEP